MARTRLISPAFFKDADLFDAEQATGLPVRLAFAGLWTVCDKEGRFAWKPRDIKADVMPHDSADFAAVLDALHSGGFIGRYVVDGKEYGYVPSWSRYQHPHKTERPSTFPSPLDNGALTVSPRVNAVAVAVTDTGTNYSVAPLKNASPEQSEKANLWALIRAHLYTPDGQCPTEGGWSEAREGSLLKALLGRYSADELAAAIEGVAVIRDHPGRYADPVTWLTPNTKATLRVLYNTSSGVLPLFSLATQAYWKRANTRTEKEKSRPAHIGTILGGAA